MSGTTFEFELDLGVFERVTERAEQNARVALSLGLTKMANEAKLLAPVGETGILAKSIRPGTVSGSLRGGDLSGYVSASAPHAEAQEFGSGRHGARGEPYPIVPRFKRALRFPVGGTVAGGSRGFAFSKGVMHPGVKPQAYLQRGVAAGLDTLERELTAGIQLAVEGGSR